MGGYLALSLRDAGERPEERGGHNTLDTGLQSTCWGVVSPSAWAVLQWMWQWRGSFALPTIHPYHPSSR